MAATSNNSNSGVQKYTIDTLLEHLALLEEHLKDFAKDQTAMCAECVFKHVLLISGLAKEGVGFFPNGVIWREVVQWAEKMRKGMDSVDTKKAQAWRERARAFRKALVAEYGQCPVCKLLAEGKGRREKSDEGMRVSHFNGGHLSF